MKISNRVVHTSLGEVKIWRLENESGAYVELSELGAGIIALSVPDKDGKIENVALGYANPSDYIKDGPCMGKIPGRYANRIAKGQLMINGKLHQLAINNGPNALHGGPEGFQNKIWNSAVLNDCTIRFTLTSPDGDEAYPGYLEASADYSWDENNQLSLRLSAHSDKETVVNLTNHAYWNLSGENSGSVLDHLLKINAEKWLPTDDTLIPTGELQSVANTPMDFRTEKTLGKEIKENFPALIYGKGYDNCWVIDSGDEENFVSEEVVEAAELIDNKSGRRLRLFTDQPGLQVYTGNWLDGSPLSRSGRNYNDYDGVALEAQGFPDAPNHDNFPSQLLKPGEEYSKTIVFAFDTVAKE